MDPSKSNRRNHAGAKALLKPERWRQCEHEGSVPVGGELRRQPLLTNGR